MELPKFKINGIEYFIDIRLKEIRTKDLKVIPLTNNDIEGFNYLIKNNCTKEIIECIKDMGG